MDWPPRSAALRERHARQGAALAYTIQALVQPSPAIRRL